MDIINSKDPLAKGDGTPQSSRKGSTYKPGKNNPITNATYKAFTVSVDVALRLCGNSHRYQLKVILLMCLQCMVASFINMGFPYLFITPDIACYPSDGDVSAAVSCTAKEACEPGISYIFPNPATNKSLSYRFDLICEEESYEGIAGALLLLGGCIGSVFYADTTERSGRIRVIRDTAWIMAISALVATFSVHIHMFSICLIFFGAAYRAYFNACIIYLTETTSDNMRQLAPNILSIGWAIGQILIAFCAMINADWQVFTLIYTAIPIVIFITFTRFMVESPRYLVAKKQFTEAKKAILAISSENSRPLPEDFRLQEEIQQRSFKDNLDKILGFTTNTAQSQQQQQQSNTAETQGKVHTFTALFQYKSLRVRTAVITYVWCTLSFSYFASAFVLEHLAGDIHYNLMAMGLGELVAYLYSGYLSLHYQRKIVIRGVLLSAGLVHLGFLALEAFDEELRIIKLASFALILTLRLSISTGNCLFNVYIAELYPTTVRHYAFGYFGLTTKLIAIFSSPFVQLFTSLSISPFIPLSVFFFAGLPMLSKLRETHGHPLRDQLEEEETAFLQTDLIPLIPLNNIPQQPQQQYQNQPSSSYRPPTYQQGGQRN